MKKDNLNQELECLMILNQLLFELSDVVAEMIDIKNRNLYDVKSKEKSNIVYLSLHKKTEI
jgi:hypothetical protein